MAAPDPPLPAARVAAAPAHTPRRRPRIAAATAPTTTALPAHELILKKHMPVMLMRNLDPANGLCNGTRLLVLELLAGNRLLKAKIATAGPHLGNVVHIPRVKLFPEKNKFPWEWSRRQFPVRPAFAMTINKAQGQTLKRVGVDLTEQIFTHGQLYVAVSRVGHPRAICFSVGIDEDGCRRAKNVVFRELLVQR